MKKIGLIRGTIIKINLLGMLYEIKKKCSYTWGEILTQLLVHAHFLFLLHGIRSSFYFSSRAI
jgi:hypothetical protein